MEPESDWRGWYTVVVCGCARHVLMVGAWMLQDLEELRSIVIETKKKYSLDKTDQIRGVHNQLLQSDPLLTGESKTPALHQCNPRSWQFVLVRNCAESVLDFMLSGVVNVIHPKATSSVDRIFGVIDGYGKRCFLGQCRSWLSLWANAEVLSQGGGGLLAWDFKKFKNRFSPYMERVPHKGSDKESVKLALVDCESCTHEQFPKEGLTLLISTVHGLHKEEHNLGIRRKALYSLNPPRTKVSVVIQSGLATHNDQDEFNPKEDDAFKHKASTQFQALHKIKPEWDEYIHFTPKQLGWIDKDNLKCKDQAADPSQLHPLTLTLKVKTENFLDSPDNEGKIELTFKENNSNSMLNLSGSSWNRHCRFLTKNDEEQKEEEDEKIKKMQPALEFQVMIRRPGSNAPKVCVRVVTAC